MIEALIVITLWCDPDLFNINLTVKQCRKELIKCVFKDGDEVKNKEFLKCLLDAKIGDL